MRKEIILPPYLYDRIKASAGEHGGIGAGALFDGYVRSGDYKNMFEGEPLCVHGHAWGTCTRYNRRAATTSAGGEPSLTPYLTWGENDSALYDAGLTMGTRIPFARWCELLNVKRGVVALEPAFEISRSIPKRSCCCCLN